MRRNDFANTTVGCFSGIDSVFPAVVGVGLRKALFNLGIEYYYVRRFPEAVDTFRRSLREDGEAPAKADIALCLGAALQQTGDRDEAFTIYLQVLHDEAARSGQVGAAISGLLCAELSEGNEEEAISLLNEVREHNASLAGNTVITLLADERLPPELREDDPEARFTLARLKRVASLVDEALADVTQALERGLADPEREALARVFKAELLEHEKLGRDALPAKEYYLAGKAWLAANPDYASGWADVA